MENLSMLMANPMIIAGVVFLLVLSLILLVAVFAGGSQDATERRMDEYFVKGGPAPDDQRQTKEVRNLARQQIEKIGQMLMSEENNKERTMLKTRLIQAGFYSPGALPVFMGIKVMLMIFPALIGVMLGVLGLVSMNWGLVVGVVFGVIGVVGPSFYLDSRKKARQTAIRRALPDAMDVIVICLEGGLSLDAAVARVARELDVAYPALSLELNICQKEAQLGHTIGEALKNFSRRLDLEELRSLAGVVLQAQKYGASMASALRIHASTLRERRSQRAEEMAHKAGTKIMFPTLLFIFPAIFLVILGPAIIQISAAFAEMK